MRRTSVTLSSVTTSAAIPLDRHQAPFNVGIGCVIAGGPPTYSVQHTFDDVQDSSVTPTWFNNSGITDKVANTDGNIAFPVSAVRLNMTGGTGSVTMTVIQGTRG